MEVSQILLLVIITLFSGVIKSSFGFGFSLIAAPFFGLAGGISGGISNINGPPILIYWESCLEKEALWATSATVFFVFNFIVSGNLFRILCWKQALNQSISRKV